VYVYGFFNRAGKLGFYIVFEGPNERKRVMGFEESDEDEGKERKMKKKRDDPDALMAMTVIGTLAT
jgi:hypothetical protein